MTRKQPITADKKQPIAPPRRGDRRASRPKNTHNTRNSCHRLPQITTDETIARRERKEYDTKNAMPFNATPKQHRPQKAQKIPKDICHGWTRITQRAHAHRYLAHEECPEGRGYSPPDEGEKKRGGGLMKGHDEEGNALTHPRIDAFTHCHRLPQINTERKSKETACCTPAPLVPIRREYIGEA